MPELAKKYSHEKYYYGDCSEVRELPRRRVVTEARPVYRPQSQIQKR